MCPVLFLKVLGYPTPKGAARAPMSSFRTDICLLLFLTNCSPTICNFDSEIMCHVTFSFRSGWRAANWALSGPQLTIAPTKTMPLLKASAAFGLTQIGAAVTRAMADWSHPSRKACKRVFLTGPRRYPSRVCSPVTIMTSAGMPDDRVTSSPNASRVSRSMATVARK